MRPSYHNIGLLISVFRRRTMSCLSDMHDDPPSTQAIFDAQFTTPPKHRSQLGDISIISISSSPEAPPSFLQVAPHVDHTRNVPNSPLRSPSQEPFAEETEDITQENSIEIVEVVEFTQAIQNYRYKATSVTTAKRPRQPLTAHKANTEEDAKGATSKLKVNVKSVLPSRVTVPIKPKISENEESKSMFFTSWAAAQAPVLRPAKASAKPRRKPVRKKQSVEVILLSPRSGQENVNKDHGDVTRQRRLGEKKCIGNMWEAASRGPEGEMYDNEGEMVFSQQLRDVDESPDVSLSNIEIVTVVAESVEAKENGQTRDINIEEDKPARRRGKAFEEVVDDKQPENEDSMPDYSSMTVAQLRVSLSHLTFLTPRMRSPNSALSHRE
jgi:hypothetical protein